MKYLSLLVFIAKDLHFPTRLDRILGQLKKVTGLNRVKRRLCSVLHEDLFPPVLVPAFFYGLIINYDDFFFNCCADNSIGNAINRMPLWGQGKD